MKALLELLAWLAAGALDPHDAARYHDALSLFIDALRHVNAELDTVLADTTLTPATRARLEVIQAVFAGARRTP
jgi:hypothetical protein